MTTPLEEEGMLLCVEYDVPTAINAGDAMLPSLLKALQCRWSHLEDLPILVRRLGGMVRQVAEGQQLDIEFELREKSQKMSTENDSW